MKFLIFILLFYSQVTLAQDATEPAASVMTNPPQTIKTEEKEEKFPEFEFRSYGYMVFAQKETFKTVQNLEPFVRRQMDLAEIAFEGEYLFTENSKVEFEIEIEHGGVGSTIEFDPFEEFGEFEQEIEKGGEVTLPEFYYKKSFPKTKTAVRVGKFPLFVALGSVWTKPHLYPTILVSDLEERMLPLNWTEMGVQVEQKWESLTGRLGLVSGLNSEFFRTYSWIGGGYQRHFESSNADNLATLVSLEWGTLSKGQGLGLSFYNGNTTGNRYKVDKLKDEASVTLWTVMGAYQWGDFGVSGEVIQGELQNSDKVASANATLGGLAKPKAFAPIGHKARLESLQVSYTPVADWTLFVKAEHVDTFADVEGSINKNPRYNVNKRSGGFQWRWDTAAFMKFQYAREKTELAGLPETYQAQIAMGFDLDSFNKE